MNHKILRRILYVAVAVLLLTLGACVPLPEDGFEPSIQEEQEEQDDQPEAASYGVDLDQCGEPITGCDDLQGSFITSF